MAFDPSTGLRNPLLAEQILQSDLGKKVEQVQGSRSVDLVRFDELFRPVLFRKPIDLSWAPERQLDALLEDESPFIALTRNGKYAALVSKLNLQNEVMKFFVKR
jgi:hypothetical protein